MKYRINADLIFDDEITAQSFMNILKRLCDKFVTIKKGMPEEERSRMSLHKCYHDEENPKPCEYIETWESK